MEETRDKTNKQHNTQLKKEGLGEFYEESFRELGEGEIVRGRVVEVGKEFVTIDVGYKSEGQIPLAQFSRNATVDVRPGDEVDVLVERREDDEGFIVLSKEKADKTRVWDVIDRACQEGDGMIEGVVISKVRGGLTVDIGVPAFLPGSQVDLHPVRDLDKYLGKRLQCKILKFNRSRGNIVLSRRAILEKEREVLKKETLKNLSAGSVVEGRVKNITE